MTKEDMIIGKEYHCRHTQQVFELCGWVKSYIDGKDVPLVKNNYNPNFTNGMKSRSWSLKYLEELTEEKKNNYLNYLHNNHKISKDLDLVVREKQAYLSSEEGFIPVNLDEMEKILEIMKKGFVRKHK